MLGPRGGEGLKQIRQKWEGLPLNEEDLMYLSCFVGICGAGLGLPESRCPVDALWRLFSAAPAVGLHRSNAAALANAGIFCFLQKALLQKTSCITS